MVSDMSSILSARKNPVILWCTALLCCALWGLAPALIKSGYAVLHISDTSSILLFAGLRFFLAGVLVILTGSLSSRRFLKPSKNDWKAICTLALFQTFGQYLFYYLGAAHASGMMVSVLSGLSALLALLFSAWIFHLESMTLFKMAGCLVGFAGILWMNTGSGGLAFSMHGEGMVFLSQISSALSAVFIQIFSKGRSPVLLSGWQFALGGLGLTACGVLMGASIGWNAAGIWIVLALAGISAAAYSLWGVLLSLWPVSSVSVFGCTIGLFGVLFSSLLLHETLSPKIAAAALLTSLGILLVNLKPDRTGRKHRRIRQNLKQ